MCSGRTNASPERHHGGGPTPLGGAEVPALLAAPDKFRGTVTAAQASEAIARGATSVGWSVHQIPLSDGGEGLLDSLGGLGGTRRVAEVEGPLGTPLEAEWLSLGPGLAVIEMARASGLQLVGGARGNDALRASTRGTGELVVAAARALSAQEPDGTDHRATIVVGLGGSATTDGGVGALEVIEEAGGLGQVALIGACDVDVGFVEAARRFGPQKGAGPTQIAALAVRLDEVAQRYERQFGIDVRSVGRAGSAGGLGGAIVVLGGRLRSGYEVVTELLGFHEVLRASRMVVTGEGAFDATSLLGKVVGSVLSDASRSRIPALVIAGRVDGDAAEAAEGYGATVVSLSERFGERQARDDTARCIEISVADALAVHGDLSADY